MYIQLKTLATKQPLKFNAVVSTMIMPNLFLAVWFRLFINIRWCSKTFGWRRDDDDVKMCVVFVG